MRTDDRRQRTEAEKVRGWEGAKTKRLEDQRIKRWEGREHRAKGMELRT